MALANVELDDLVDQLMYAVRNGNEPRVSDEDLRARLTSIVKPPLEVGRSVVTTLYLCEKEHLFLKPGQLYFFLTHPTCKRCLELAEASNG